LSLPAGLEVVLLRGRHHWLCLVRGYLGSAGVAVHLLQLVRGHASLGRTRQRR